MAQLAHIKNISKTVSNLFPRVNKTHFIESSIHHTFIDEYMPINNVDTDRFIEFRIPRSVGNFIDLASIHLQFHLMVKKRTASANAWSAYSPTVFGDHFALSEGAAYSLFKHLSIDFNGVQVTNVPNYALDSYIRLLTQFPNEEVNKLGKLLGISNPDTVIRSTADDSYFDGLQKTDPNAANHLKLIRDKGLHLRAPLITDITGIQAYLLDGIEIVIRLTLHENSSVILTAQNNPSVDGDGNKKFYLNISNISLQVKKIKPTDNSYTALQQTLLPKAENVIPMLDYVFTSRIVKQYHLPSGQAEHYLDLPYGNTIPDRIFIVFQHYSNFNTKAWKENLLYLEHLELSNIYVTINGTTMFNINCDFENYNVAELYNLTLLSLRTDKHLLTYEKFINGCTVIGLPLSTYDASADIRAPYFGVLRIRLTFTTRLADPAIAYLSGDIISILSINSNRNIYLNSQ